MCHCGGITELLTLSCYSCQLLESSCDAEIALDLASTSQSSLSVSDAAVIEEDAAAYFMDLMLPQVESSDDLDEILEVSVRVLNGRSIQDGQKSLLSIQSSVSIIYRTGRGLPMNIDNVLTRLVEADNISELKFNELPVDSFKFGGIVNDSKILFYGNAKNERTTADAGLIAATVIMSFILLLVSSVLLYITGGWDAFQQAVTNCLFEEVEDDDGDHYLARSKPDFHVSPTEDDEDREIEADEPSVVTGMQTSASGMLGVRVPTEGLGIGNGYLTDGDEATNFTDMSAPQRLGINSASKMALGDGGDEEAPTGLAQMIMRRMGNTPN